MQLMLLKWKKKVISQTAGQGNMERTNKIIEQVRDVNNRINNINTFTNLQLRLNSLYLKTGYIRNKEELEQVSIDLISRVASHIEQMGKRKFPPRKRRT